MTARFDAILIVDWSAANAPKRGKDSIWIAEARADGRPAALATPVNPDTRAAAMALLSERIRTTLAKNERLMIGFDFPFGYPAGTAPLFGARGWSGLWARLRDEIDDGDDNRSNRFALADRWNRDVFREPFFWGRPHQRDCDFLPANKPASERFRSLEWRVVERWQRPAKSLWQLAYNGAVGSQAMLGLARLEALRRAFRDQLIVWPFETRWADRLDAPVILTEVYPSMITPEWRDGEVKDCAQVRSLAGVFARLDAAGRLASLLSRPVGMSDAENARVLTEEGWIAGVGHDWKA